MAALPLFRAAFAIHQTAFGQADIETCRSLRNLGLAYRDVKDTRRAVRAFGGYARCPSQRYSWTSPSFRVRPWRGDTRTSTPSM